jgi:hypothetical protein
MLARPSGGARCRKAPTADAGHVFYEFHADAETGPTVNLFRWSDSGEVAVGMRITWSHSGRNAQGSTARGVPSRCLAVSRHELAVILGMAVCAVLAGARVVHRDRRVGRRCHRPQGAGPRGGRHPHRERYRPGAFPSFDYQVNAAWLSTTMTAQILLAWLKLLTLDAWVPQLV